MEGFEIYISDTGYLMIPKFDISYLIDFYESNIPSMPESTETAVRIAGRDGDIALKDTYEPMSFEIVCYTDDNLSSEEKIKEENKINKFLNSIKNKTVAFGMEKEEKFYDVKYSGALTTSKFPKHIKFSIPLKASNPYAKYYLQRKVVGESEFESNTIKEVGGVFTINGPATNPKISFNNYEIYYDNSLLEGSRLEIDSSKSTITHINSLGVKTNAMRYYNHQFPKIQNGINQLEIISGISNEEQLSLSWYDLKL